MRIALYSFDYLKVLIKTCRMTVTANEYVPGVLLNFEWSMGQQYGMILSVDEKNKNIQVLFGE